MKPSEREIKEFDKLMRLKWIAVNLRNVERGKNRASRATYGELPRVLQQTYDDMAEWILANYKPKSRARRKR